MSTHRRTRLTCARVPGGLFDGAFADDAHPVLQPQMTAGSSVTAAHAGAGMGTGAEVAAKYAMLAVRGASLPSIWSRNPEWLMSRSERLPG